MSRFSPSQQLASDRMVLKNRGGKQGLGWVSEASGRGFRALGFAGSERGFGVRKQRVECAGYFLSRAKENQVLNWIECRAWNRADPRNQGVQKDPRVRTRAGHTLRLICYVDPLTDSAYEFLTNELTCPGCAGRTLSPSLERRKGV